MKLFTEKDIDARGRIWITATDLVDEPPNWMKLGLQQTATGYGGKLNSGRKINFNGRLYRIYVTCYSNAGSYWFNVKGRKIFLS